MRIHEFQGTESLCFRGGITRQPLPDLRHTMYWNPRVDLKDEEPVTLRTTTPQTKGTFVVVAEGMSLDGKAFRTSAEFVVK